MDLQDLCLPRVSAILILDADGGRIACKAFTPRLQSSGALKSLQSRIFQRSKLNSGAEIGDVFLLDDYSVIFKGSSDALFYVVGDNAENELILQAVLDALVETLAGLLRGMLDRRVLLDNLAIVLLTLDEVVDSGMILETNPQALRQRVMMRGSEDGTNQAMSELTISEALNQARESMIKTIGRN